MCFKEIFYAREGESTSVAFFFVWKSVRNETKYAEFEPLHRSLILIVLVTLIIISYKPLPRTCFVYIRSINIYI